jgi:prolyl-tRNA editing enzyme YbaK/EbsC (Cys-tRNA(Pro) deacylase)
MRRVTLIPKDVAIQITGMEYGSMTAVGLPNDWKILVDSRIISAAQIILSSGLTQAKLRLPGRLLLEMENSESVPDLALF